MLLLEELIGVPIPGGGQETVPAGEAVWMPPKHADRLASKGQVVLLIEGEA